MVKWMIHFRENFLNIHDTVQCFSMFHHCFVQNLLFLSEIDRGSIPGHDRHKSLKQVMTARLPNARQQVWVSRVLRDDHYKPISRDTVGLAKNPSWPHKINDRVSSIGQNLQPFTGGYVSIYVKNSRVGQKTQDQQSIHKMSNSF